MPVTHLFHPLAGQELEVVERRHNWGEDRVFFIGDDGQLRSVPAGWTDVDPPDPFLVIACWALRVPGRHLLGLASLLDGIRPRRPPQGV